MSKFVDKLKKISQEAPQPMGFGVAKPAPGKPKMLLIASLSSVAAGGSADYVAGADAGLLSVPKLSSAGKVVKDAAQAVPDIPWGVWLKEISQNGMKQLSGAGCDFAVFPPSGAPLEMLRNSEVGRILEVDTSLEESLLSTVGVLPADAVFVAQEEGSLTWQHLMLFRHFSALVAKPLLVPVPSSVTGDELQALWEAGVVGVVVKVGAGQPEGGLKSLRETIDKLTFPPRRKRRRAEPLVPYVGEIALEEAEEEEE